MKTHIFKNREWWKWGEQKKRKALTQYPKLKEHLENLWSQPLDEKFSFPSQVQMNNTDTHTESLKSSLGHFEISFDVDLRFIKTFGKSYKDLIIAMRADFPRIVDAVITPRSTSEVKDILKICSEKNIVLIPFGGGSNVVGDFDVPRSEARPTVSLDLSQLNHVLKIDTDKKTVASEAGVFGPQLESELNKMNMTLGHFPQSFEYSTLGGWIVTRSAGQESSLYGRIEDQVISLKAETPIGTFQTTPYEGEASGINLKSVFFGSEGSLGVVTEATLRIQPLSAKSTWVVGVFPSFANGLIALKKIAQMPEPPSVVRFSDEHETFFLSLLSTSGGTFDSIKSYFKKLIFKIKNLKEPSLLMIRFESFLDAEDHYAEIARDIFNENGALLLGQSLGKKWEHSRFGLPYLRDDLVERFIVVDTMETVLPWDKIDEFRKKLKEILSSSEEFNGKKGILLTHVSHVYHSCASMYFTVLTPMVRDNPLSQWTQIKSKVTDAIMESGGAVSHHHGVGRDHQSWYIKNQDPVTKAILKNLKSTMDPKNILTPGKLLDDTK